MLPPALSSTKDRKRTKQTCVIYQDDRLASLAGFACLTRTCLLVSVSRMSLPPSSPTLSVFYHFRVCLREWLRSGLYQAPHRMLSLSFLLSRSTGLAAFAVVLYGYQHHHQHDDYSSPFWGSGLFPAVPKVLGCLLRLLLLLYASPAASRLSSSLLLVLWVLWVCSSLSAV